jgi:DNA-binding MarR family transcriptional regulator
MLQAALTIYPNLRAFRPPMDRQQAIRDLLDELASHTPAAAVRYMRHWPGGTISLVHLNVLSLLEVDGPLPMRILAESLDVSQACATGIVDRMEQRGLVERRRDDEDRRIVRVALTDEGRRLIAGIAAERRDHLQLVLVELTDEELEAFLLGARAMHRARERLHATHHATTGSATSATPATSATHPTSASPSTPKSPKTPSEAPR